MDNILENVLNLLEVPGLSIIIRNYKETIIRVDNKLYLNRKQFISLSHTGVKNIFSYGTLELTGPSGMFENSEIETFTSKGVVRLFGESIGMFNNSAFFNSDLNNWDVFNVTDMRYMFARARNFKSDLSTWRVDNVTNMICMFLDANQFESDLSKWNVHNVTSTIHMFRSASSFDSDLSGWNLENVINARGMFQNAISFNSDVNKWNMEGIICMHSMFQNASSFNSDLTGWNILDINHLYC